MPQAIHERYTGLKRKKVLNQSKKLAKSKINNA
jgi:hypothetical protein